MVQSAGTRVEALGRQVEDPRHLFDAVEDAVAEADDTDAGETAGRFAEFGERVGVVDEQGVRAVSLHGSCDVDGGAHVAERVEEAAGSAVFAVDLAEAEGAGDVKVLRPVEVAVDFDRHDDGVGTGERVGDVAGV